MDLVFSSSFFFVNKISTILFQQFNFKNSISTITLDAILEVILFFHRLIFKIFKKVVPNATTLFEC